MHPLGSLALVASSAATSALLVVLSHNLSNPPHSPLLGLYEPSPSAAQKGSMDLAATFFNWNDPDLLDQVEEFLAQARTQRRLPLLTLEPFPDKAAGRRDADLLPDVVAGRYDATLQALGDVLAKEPGPVLLRFGHEMDITGQYAWSYENPAQYIQLYRSVFHRINAQRLPQVRWVWSPAGSPTAHQFWPGDAHVDLIGISIYASRAWTSDGSLQGFAEQLAEKNLLHRRFRRPLLVAETGVSGSAAEQRRWLAAALESLPQFPEVCGLVYFHAPQPSWMPLPSGHENWQLQGESLSWLLRQGHLPERRGLRCLEA
jgi:beta-mannanase